MIVAHCLIAKRRGRSQPHAASKRRGAPLGSGRTPASGARRGVPRELQRTPFGLGACCRGPPALRMVMSLVPCRGARRAPDHPPADSTIVVCVAECQGQATSSGHGSVLGSLWRVNPQRVCRVFLVNHQATKCTAHRAALGVQATGTTAEPPSAKRLRAQNTATKSLLFHICSPLCRDTTLRCCSIGSHPPGPLPQLPLSSQQHCRVDYQHIHIPSRRAPRNEQLHGGAAAAQLRPATLEAPAPLRKAALQV